ncbi:zf-CGNR multi-domain protein [Kribbella antibiotica]|uniref:Zf-CGNR multi-domain protein n=1 Tax=Kribbella antibiotica TaxID=190195 RepID=A0A4R4YTA8_9ACTN|nr:CGNR zinc finger domain-containing protein [Kribbella antibiotica]TDD48483.1 zf-CGNR multi-domain protein [Kribbella antibiotica]
MKPGARRLRTRDGVTHTFDPGSFALELILSGGPPPWDRYEQLNTPDDAAAWLAESYLAADLPFTAEDVRVTKADLARLKDFRELLWHVVPGLIADAKDVPGIAVRRLSPADRGLLNASVGETPHRELDEQGAIRWRTPITTRQVLGAAAEDLIEIIGSDRVSRLRMCQGDNCALMFYDTSRPGNRRWCSMQRCGNRHKVGNYRTRHTD